MYKFERNLFRADLREIERKASPEFIHESSHLRTFDFAFGRFIDDCRLFGDCLLFGDS